MGKMALLTELTALRDAALKLVTAGPSARRAVWIEVQKALRLPAGPLPWEEARKER